MHKSDQRKNLDKAHQILHNKIDIYHDRVANLLSTYDPALVKTIRANIKAKVQKLILKTHGELKVIKQNSTNEFYIYKIQFSQFELDFYLLLELNGINVSFDNFGTQYIVDRKKAEQFFPTCVDFSDFLVVHHTGSDSNRSVLDLFHAGKTFIASEKNKRISAHFVIPKADKAILYVISNLHTLTFSCGNSVAIIGSKFFKHMNKYSINIEIVGKGYAKSDIEQIYYSTHEKQYFQIGYTKYFFFSEKQKFVLKNLINVFLSLNSNGVVLTHQRISSLRKGDIACSVNMYNINQVHDFYNEFADYNSDIAIQNVYINSIRNLNDQYELRFFCKLINNTVNLLNQYFNCCFYEHSVYLTAKKDESTLIKFFYHHLWEFFCLVRSCIQDYMPIEYIYRICKEKNFTDHDGKVQKILYDHDEFFINYLYVLYDRERCLQNFSVDILQNQHFIEFFLLLSNIWLKMIISKLKFIS